jgi:hypothetical protein
MMPPDPKVTQIKKSIAVTLRSNPREGQAAIFERCLSALSLPPYPAYMGALNYDIAA